MGSESSEQRPRNIAGWRQSFRQLCCSSSNTKEAAEESIKPLQSRQRNIAGWRQSFRELCCSSSNTKQAAEDVMKPPQSEDDSWESEEARQRATLAKWQASLVDLMNKKDELSTQPKRRFQWKHNKRLHQLDVEMDRASDLIKRSEQEISRGYPSASATVNNNQSDGLGLPTHGYFFISKSVKRAACQMLMALENQEVHLIGLVGVQGVGKTTLANLVAHKAQRSRLFDQVLKIDSDSHSRERFELDGDKIWHQMAALLGVEDTPLSAKSRLNKKLEEGKKILIILDDVWWKKPKLEALGGIPYGQRCKILVITCLPQVCAGIGCHATIQLNGLTREEAREWYKRIRLRIMESLPITRLQGSKDIYAKKKLPNWEKQIVGASQGLPFSVLTIDEKLQKQESVNFPTQNLVGCINEHVFNYLKLHYDFLGDQESKSFFILCSHFSEGCYPTFEHLTRYAYGGPLKKSFESVGSIHDARRKIYGLISELQSYSLLEVHKDQVVKMPDLFRRLAHWIAEQDGQKILAGSNSNGFLDIFPSLSTACVSNKQLKDILGRDVMECTKLESLIAFTKEKEEVGDPVRFLTSVFGRAEQKKKREGSSHDISEEEEEEEEEEKEEEFMDPVTYPTSVFKRMVNLKVLFLLERISSVQTRKCLSLEGLQLLTGLQTLQLQGYKLKDLPSLGKLTNLEILCFISCDIDQQLDVLRELSSLKLLELSCVKLSASVSLDWIGQLSKLEELYMTDASIKVPDMNSSINLNVKHLELTEVRSCRNLLPNFSKQGLNQLEVLKLDKCNSLECLVDATELKEVQRNMEGCCIEAANQMKPILGFPNLTNLELRNLDSLSCLWKGESHMSLEKLKVMVIDSCGLTCESLFPTYVVEGLKQLEILHIFRCNNLKSILMEDYSANSLSLANLTTLKIESCSKLEYVFPIAMAEGPPRLRELEIKSCKNLQHVFIYKVEARNQQTHAFVLPELKRLRFKGLSALRRITAGADTLEAPLEELDISSCNKLEPFSVTPKKGDLPRLKIVNLEACGEWYLEEEIFALRENSSSCSRLLEYGTLKHLKLGVRLKSTTLWRRHSQVTGMQDLARLELYGVNLRYVFTAAGVRNIPQLMHLSIASCKELEYIIEDDQPSGSITAENRTQCRPTYFPNLAEIEIKDCNKLKSAFPASLAKFPKLQSFMVERSDSLTQIFTDEEAHAGVKYHQSSKLEFPRVRKLSLIKLPCLVCFAPVGYHCIFPSLSSPRIEACPKSNIRVDFNVKREALAHLAASSSTSVTDTTQLLTPFQFSGQDYDIWCVEMKTYLVSQDLWEIVEKRDGSSWSNEDKKRDAQALSIIQQSLTKRELHQMLVGANSARNAWDILREEYQGDRLDNKKEIHRSLFPVPSRCNNPTEWWNFCNDIY